MSVWRDAAEYFQLGQRQSTPRLADARAVETTADLIVGISTSFHDGAVAFLEQGPSGGIFVESLERSCQLKRALLVASLHYMTASLRRSFLGRIRSEATDVTITVRSTWRPRIAVRIIGDIYVRLLRLRARFALRAAPAELPAPIVFATRLPQIWFWDTALFPVYHLKSELFAKQRILLRNRQTYHHLTHAANACYTAPFGDCAVMVLDGQGEWYSLTCYVHHAGGGTKPPRLERIAASRDSLGLLYADVTTLCGFSPTEGEEWKVMGLAAYGQVDQRIKALFMESTKVDGLSLKLRFDEKATRKLRELCGGFREPGDADVMRAANLAASFQSYFSDTVIALTRALQQKTGARCLAYSGGCALNSATNGLLVGAATGFETLHVPSAPADDGNALGAALFERHLVRGQPYQPETMSPYLGSAVDIDELTRLLALQGLKYRVFASDAAASDAVAELLAAGEIVGVMRGRAEFGPRALGHRSLLADPRRADMKHEINRLVKFREDYRPLAPSILDEHGPDWFEAYQKSPYMERALRFRPDRRKLVPAVVHADGTGRLQSVTKALCPNFHALISAFHQRTGVPLVVNTSLNVMGKPIVHSVKDAIQLLYTSGLRQILMERILVHK